MVCYVRVGIANELAVGESLADARRVPIRKVRRRVHRHAVVIVHHKVVIVVPVNVRDSCFNTRPNVLIDLRADNLQFGIVVELTDADVEPVRAVARLTGAIRLHVVAFF